MSIDRKTLRALAEEAIPYTLVISRPAAREDVAFFQAAVPEEIIALLDELDAKDAEIERLQRVEVAATLVVDNASPQGALDDLVLASLIIALRAALKGGA